MARPLRTEFAGALYHITARGNERRDIFFTDDDRSQFLDTLEEVREIQLALYAFCQMTNHYHLLIETAEANLCRGMQQLNGVYATGQSTPPPRGHLLQVRYTVFLVQKETYLLELARYIVLNPVRARMVPVAGDWVWSSYRATVGLRTAPRFLTTDWLLSAFGGARDVARKAFACFVAAGIRQPSPWVQLKNQIYLGSEQFVEEMQGRIDAQQPLQEIPAKRDVPLPANSLITPIGLHPEIVGLRRRTTAVPTAWGRSRRISA